MTRNMKLAFGEKGRTRSIHAGMKHIKLTWESEIFTKEKAYRIQWMKYMKYQNSEGKRKTPKERKKLLKKITTAKTTTKKLWDKKTSIMIDNSRKEVGVKSFQKRLRGQCQKLQRSKKIKFLRTDTAFHKDYHW